MALVSLKDRQGPIDAPPGSGEPFFTLLDHRFGRLMASFCPDEDALVRIAATLASAHTRRGHVCLDLKALAGRRVLYDVAPESPARYPAFGQWTALLRQSPVVGGPGEFKPLILDAAGRLYLYRYWRYENRLADRIRSMAAEPLDRLDETRFREALFRLFPDSSADGEWDWQAIACALANLKRFCVISGGPGTGKTSTVIKILALMIAQRQITDPNAALRIRMAAPTGKAAARLTEAVNRAKATLACEPGVVSLIPSDAVTVHRLLKPVAGTPDFHHNERHPLAADVVVIDEASMVDIALMAKLAAAIPPAGRLILLGDKDQLASVEAGAVLGDICGESLDNRFTTRTARTLERLTGQRPPISNGRAPALVDSRVQLTKSYRFPDTGMIAALGRAVNGGQAEAASAMLAAPWDETVRYRPLPSSAEFLSALRQRVLEGYAAILTETDPARALSALGRFKILCAVNFGPFGVTGVNRFAEKMLYKAGLLRWSPAGRAGLEPGSRGWYHGRPVLVVRNDYRLRLFNGDVGIALRDPREPRGPLWVYFQGDDGTLKKFPPEQLPENETVFAMTVHKSQGSEFDRVLLILPDQPYPVLTRELVYTAITRAVTHLELWAEASVLKTAVRARIRRNSGLRDALWGETAGMAP